MEKDYIKIYLETFEKVEIEAEKGIKEKFIDLERKGKNHQFAANKIMTDFHEEEKKLVITEAPFSELIYIYKRRLDEYNLKTQMNVIPEILLPKFLEINIDQFRNFEDFIIELAKLNARFNIYNQFNNSSDFYGFLFRVNDFSDFKIKDFECSQYSDVFEEYRIKVIEKEAEESKSTLGKIKNIISNEQENSKTYYKFKSEYLGKFLTIDSFNILCNEFINEQKTSYEDFVQFFSEESNNPKIKLHFWCESYLASFLISTIVKRVYKSLTLKEFTQKFIFSKEETRMSDNYISSSKRGVQERDGLKVENALKYIRKLNIDK